MEDPIIFYQDNKDNDEVYDEAVDTLLRNPLSYNKEGIDKFTNIDSIDQESILKKISNLPLIGNFYTFINLDNDINQNGPYESSPILFLTKVDQDGLHGINSLVLTRPYRAILVHCIYESDPYFYKTEMYNNIKEGDIAINNTLIKILSNKTANLKFIKYISRSLKKDISLFYKVYPFKNLLNLRLIEYTDWKYIPFLR